MNIEITYKPQPRQEVFHKCNAYEVLYGGAAGGGKTESLLHEGLISCLEVDTFKTLYLRRTFPDLDRSVIRRSQTTFPKNIGKYNEVKHLWTFLNGSTLEFGSLDREMDVLKYQSAEYDLIIFDELTHFTEFQYTYMKSRNRTILPGVKPRMRAGTNPGNIGHAWVKSYFIEPAPPETIFKTAEGTTRCFIPAKVTDNLILMQRDPEYIRRLDSLPENERKALRDGDWDIFSGQVFSEWKRDTHVIEPRMPKKNYLCYRSLDWGYSRPFSIGWWYIDEDGNAVRYRELYGCTGKPDEGLKLDPYTVGQMIAERETKDEETVYGIADSSCWDTDDGAESIIYLLNKALLENDLTPFNRKADKRKGSRIAGKMQLHYRLKNSLEGNANGIYICENCTDFIRTVPTLIYDDKQVEDVNTSQEDHAYDETRYFLDSKPVTSEPVKEDTRDYPEEEWMYEESTNTWFD